MKSYESFCAHYRLNPVDSKSYSAFLETLSKRRIGMSEKTMPKWGETVHVDGVELVVTRVDSYWVTLRNKRDGAIGVGYDGIDEYKPRTITIGDMEVPEPVREPLEIGEDYYRVNFNDVGPFRQIWEGCNAEYNWLRLGLIQKTKGGFYQHRKALIRVSGGETE